jgi:hypothetical protein
MTDDNRLITDEELRNLISNEDKRFLNNLMKIMERREFNSSYVLKNLRDTTMEIHVTDYIEIPCEHLHTALKECFKEPRQMSEDEKVIVLDLVRQIDKYYINVRDNIERLYKPKRLVEMGYKEALELFLSVCWQHPQVTPPLAFLAKQVSDLISTLERDNK